MNAFVRGANEQDVPLQLAAVKALLVTTLFCRGWLSQLPRIGSFFIHYTDSLVTERLEELNKHDCGPWRDTYVGLCLYNEEEEGLRLIPVLNNSIFTEQLIESTYMRLGHQPGRATWIVGKCPDDELGTQLRRLWRGKFQPRQNVRECAHDSQRPKGGVSEEHFRQASTWTTTDHIATCKVAHGDVNAHHALEFGKTMVKWFRKS